MKKIVLLLAVSLILSAICFFTVFADGYDSTTDPVITLSYVNNNLLPQIDSRINELKTLIDNGTSSSGGSGISTSDFSALVSRVSAIEKKLDSQQGPSAAGPIYTVVFVEHGKTLIAPKTAIELILRSGTATVVSPFDDQGLSDITSGNDLLNGVSVSKNHEMIIPRAADGRGILVTSPEGAYVMVRGEYEIVN